MEVMHSTLTHFSDFCKDSRNNMPSGIFEDFASELGFDASTCSIPHT